MNTHILITAVLLVLSQVAITAQNPKPGQNAPNATNPARPSEPLQFKPELMRRQFPGQDASGAAPAAKSEPSEVFSIDFPGGTPPELVQVIKQTIGKTPNVMIAPVMAEIYIPPFQLQNVTLSDIFQALNNLADESAQLGQWQLTGSNEPIWVLNPKSPGVDPFTGVPMSHIDPLTGQPIMRAVSGGSSRLPRACQIFPVAKYLSEYKIEDLTTAIQTALKMLGEEAGADIKFHKDTKLLISVGTHTQISVIQQVLMSLDQGMPQKKQSPSEPDKTQAR